MAEVFRAHVITNLRFFARSRLILAFALCVLGVWSLGLVPFILFETSGQRLVMAGQIAQQLHSLAWFCGAGLALVAMASNLRGGATRLVLTRPTPPEVWIASILAAAFLVAAVVHVMAELIVVALCFVWDVPYQFGFLYGTLESMTETLIAVSIAAVLAALIHPALAVIVMILGNDAIAFELRKMFMSAEHAKPEQWWLGLVDWPLRAIYLALPMLDPFSEEMSAVSSSLRVSADDWLYLVASAGYALLVAAFAFSLSTYKLRRRPMMV